MAPLTWRNVDAPDLGKASEILNSSARMFGGAMDGINDSLTGIRDRQRRDRSAQALPVLARVANEQGVNPALEQLGSMIKPDDMTAELQQAMMNLRGGALDFESSRAATDGRRASTGVMLDGNNRLQETHDTTRARDSQLAGLTGALVGNNQVASGNFDWQKHAVGGAAARDDSFTGLQPEYADRVSKLVTAAEKELGPGAIKITSAYRSPGVQADIIAKSMDKYGLGDQAGAWIADVQSMGPEAAGEKWRPKMKAAGLTKMIAMPGGSDHQRGTAVDFSDANGRLIRDPNSKEAQWLRNNVEGYGLNIPMDWEPWQVGMAGGSQGAGAGGAGGGQGQMQDISAMVSGPGNLVRPSDIMGDMETNNNRAIATENQGYVRVQKALEAQTRADAEANQLLVDQAEQSLIDRKDSLPPTYEQAKQELLDTDMSIEQRRIQGAALEQFYSNNAEQFETPIGPVPEALAPVITEVTSLGQEATAGIDYLRQQDAAGDLLSRATSNSGRTAMEVVGSLNEQLGDNPINQGDWQDGVREISREFRVSQGVAAELMAAQLTTKGGLIRDKKVVPDVKTLMAELKGVLGSSSNFAQTRMRSESLDQDASQLGDLQNKATALQNDFAYWDREGADPERKAVEQERITGELAEVQKQFQTLHQNVNKRRDRWDQEYNPEVYKEEQAARALAQAAAENPTDPTVIAAEQAIVDAVVAGDLDATERVKAKLVEEGIDPRVAENSTELKKLVGRGILGTIQMVDDAVGDLSALVGRGMSAVGKGAAYTYGTVDPKNASKAIGVLDRFEEIMNALAKDGFISGNPEEVAQYTPKTPEDLEAMDELSKEYKAWRGMSRAERKDAGLPTSEIGAQIHFNRFLEGFR